MRMISIIYLYTFMDIAAKVLAIVMSLKEEKRNGSLFIHKAWTMIQSVTKLAGMYLSIRMTKTFACLKHLVHAMIVANNLDFAITVHGLHVTMMLLL